MYLTLPSSDSAVYEYNRYIVGNRLCGVRYTTELHGMKQNKLSSQLLSKLRQPQLLKEQFFKNPARYAIFPNFPKCTLAFNWRFHIQISLRMFSKNWNCPRASLMVPEEAIWWKKISKISRHCPFKGTMLKNNWLLLTGVVVCLQLICQKFIILSKNPEN